MVLQDKLLLDISIIIGINQPRYIRSQIKYFSVLTIFLYCISMIHFIMAYLYCVIQGKPIQGASFLFVAATSLLIYYLLIVRRKKISRLLMKLFNFRYRYKTTKMSSSACLKFFIVTISIILFVLNEIINFITVPIPDASIHYWTFGAEIPEGAWKAVILTLISLSQYVSYLFQLFLSLILCIIFYKFAEMLQVYNKHLQLELHCMNKQKIVVLTEDYFNMRKIEQKFHQVLNTPSFFIVVYAANFLFSSLLLALKNGRALFIDYAIFIDVLSGLIIGVCILIPYAVSSSMITEKFLEIKKTVQDKNNDLARSEKLWIPQCVIKSLKRIEKDEIEHMHACGLFYISRGFILTAIGALLSYDLLIINYL